MGARASVHTPTPPKAGWRIPWDAEKIEPGALVVEPVAATAAKPQAQTGGGKAAPKATSTATAAPPAVQPAVRVKKTTDLVTSTETAVNAAVANAKKVIENEKATEGQIKVQVDLLTKQQTKLTE